MTGLPYRHPPTTIQFAYFHFLTSATEGDQLVYSIHCYIFFQTQLWAMLKYNIMLYVMIPISLVRHVFSNRRDIIVHSDRNIIVTNY